jgi:hypothetical protein
VKRAAMMTIAVTIAVTTIGIIVFVGYMAMRAIVFMLEIASKLMEELT